METFQWLKASNKKDIKKFQFEGPFFSFLFYIYFLCTACFNFLAFTLTDIASIVLCSGNGPRLRKIVHARPCDVSDRWDLVTSWRGVVKPTPSIYNAKRNIIFPIFLSAFWIWKKWFYLICSVKKISNLAISFLINWLEVISNHSIPTD